VTPADSHAAPSKSQISAAPRDCFLLDDVELGARVADSFVHATAS
jgi:hypothetical protein